MDATLDIDAPASDLVLCATPKDAVSRLIALFDEAHAQTRERFERYLKGGDGLSEAGGAVYPYLCAVVPAEAAPVSVTVAGLPTDRVLLQHYRIDQAHSNAWEAWKAMGSPQAPTAEQYAELEK